MNYKNSRNIAWKILINNKVSELPVDVFKICEHERVRLITYEKGKTLIKDLNLEEHTVDNDAFSFNRVIMYDDSKPVCRQRFSIAHELGHIYMHISNSPTVFNREGAENGDPIEAEANIFASRLLAPLCILQFLNLNSAKEIAEVCNIGYTAAQIRFSRLCQIRKRNSVMRKSKGHGSFLTSKLEREVCKNFQQFIEANRRPFVNLNSFNDV